MSKLIKLLEKSVASKATDKIDTDMLYNAIYFVLASAANVKTKLRYQRYQDDTLRIVNYFGITFSGTGDGKDFVINSVVDEFGKLKKIYPKLVDKKFNTTVSRAESCSINHEKQNWILPDSLFCSVEGTPEGFQKTMQGMAYAEGFSLNITHGEFGDILMNADMLSRIKEAWDSGSGRGKMIAGGGYFAVEDIPVNVLLYGTPYSIKSSPQKIDKIKSELINGFGRRSFLFFGKNKKIEPNPYKDCMTKEEKEQLTSLALKYLKLTETDDIRIVKYSKEATDKLNEYVQYLKNEYNQDEHNELKKSIATSFLKIERLAVIIALSDFSTTVEPHHMQVAIDFNERTKQHLFEISKGYQPHALIFENLVSKSMSRVMLLEEISQLNSRNFNEYLELAKEYALHQMYTIKEGKQHIKMYSAEQIQDTNLDKMIVSVAMDNKREHSIDMKPLKIPFFGSDIKSIESLVRSKVSCFSLAHFSPSDTATHGHRRADNFIEGQNIIAVDVDNGLPLETALVLLKDYVHIIYTTKSHQKEGKGDRFRIILPTNKEFFVSPEVHKDLIANVCKVLGVTSYDASTRNVSRLWFTNPEAEIFINKDGNLFDVMQCIPNTERSTKMLDTIDKVDALSIEPRIEGIYLWFLNSADVGNRNASLYRVAMMFKELGVDNAIEHMHKMNAMLVQPLKDAELNTIIKSAKL
jgi:hypothetical protein